MVGLIYHGTTILMKSCETLVVTGMLMLKPEPLNVPVAKVVQVATGAATLVLPTTSKVPPGMPPVPDNVMEPVPPATLPEKTLAVMLGFSGVVSWPNTVIVPVPLKCRASIPWVAPVEPVPP